VGTKKKEGKKLKITYSFSFSYYEKKRHENKNYIIIDSVFFVSFRLINALTMDGTEM
jgi:hypothetical protein